MLGAHACVRAQQQQPALNQARKKTQTNTNQRTNKLKNLHREQTKQANTTALHEHYATNTNQKTNHSNNNHPNNKHAATYTHAQRTSRRSGISRRFAQKLFHFRVVCWVVRKPHPKHPHTPYTLNATQNP